MMTSKKFMKKIMIMRSLRDDSGIKSTWCASLNTGVYIPAFKLKIGVLLYKSLTSKYDRGEDRSIIGLAWYQHGGKHEFQVQLDSLWNYKGGESLRRTPAYPEGNYKHVCTLSHTHSHTGQIYTCIHIHLHTERWNKPSC